MTYIQFEDLRNNILNVEGSMQELDRKVDLRFETIAIDITTTISEMDDFDGKIEQALDQTLSDTSLGQKVVEMLSGGLRIQGAEIAGIKDDPECGYFSPWRCRVP